MNFPIGLSNNISVLTIPLYTIESHRELTLDVSTLSSSQLERIRLEFRSRRNYSYVEYKIEGNGKTQHIRIIPMDESTPVFPIQEIFK